MATDPNDPLGFLLEPDAHVTTRNLLSRQGRNGLTASTSIRSKHPRTPRLGQTIVIHVAWLIPLFLLPSAAAGIGSGGKFKAVENVWYLGQNNNAAVNAALVIWWLLTVGAYCYLWYRGAIKQSSRTAATFSIAQQAIQSGITCGCRAIFFAYAVFQLAVWSEILNTPAKGWGPEHVDVGTGEMFIETLLAAFSVGAVVAAIAALVRYASTEPNTKP